MTGTESDSSSSQAWHRELAERDRAVRAAHVALRHEMLGTTGPAPARPLHRRMAEIHRQIERRHLVAARLYGTMAASHQDPNVQAMQLLMSAMAEVAEPSGAIVMLVGPGRHETVALTSDPVSARVYDLEFQLGEGPSVDALRTRRPVAVAGRGRLCEQWPPYGPARPNPPLRPAPHALPPLLISL